MTETSFFEHLQNHFEEQLPFITYKKPNEFILKGIFQNNDSLYKTETFEEEGFIMSPFDIRRETVLIPADVSEVFSTTIDSSKIEDAERNLEIKLDGKNRHINLVNKGIDAISKGYLKKVVLSRREEVKTNQKTPLDIFKSMLKKYANAFVYYWFHPKVGVWVGATPETLMQIDGKRFSIMSLAGTKEVREGDEVVWQKKEIEEQQYVTDFILENIQSSIKDVKVSNTETAKAGNLVHLKTRIKGTISDAQFSFKELLLNIHPTPAVCGLPTEKARDFILENEGYNREFYTGFLGELNFKKQVSPRTAKRNIENRAYTYSTNSTQLYVNLRCAKLVQDKAYIYVGGGITEKSQAIQEWEETVAKAKTIKSVL